MTVWFVIAVAVLGGLVLFLVHELRRPVTPVTTARGSRWMKQIRIGLGALVLLVACLVFWGFFVEPNRLVVRRQTIEIAQWPRSLDGLRVAVIADIHAGGWFIDEAKLRKIVEQTNQLQPEMIVILGDYVAGDGRRHQLRMAPEVFGPILKDLHAPLGVYSVLGNHDWWFDGFRVRRVLEQNGIKVLDNEVMRVDARGGALWLVGLADLWTRAQLVEETIAEVPAGAPLIALAHNPDIFPRLPSQVPLLLAAHTHGGQVRFPFFGSVIHPSDYGQRYAAGHVIENGHHLFVTTGIGTSILPVRFGVPPEIVLLTLKSQ